ncbi:MAG: PAS domain S-box protein, partial [Actinobacteria bacterium]|nr:PAS domain S-box protein [Actinomycetota bacterium]
GWIFHALADIDASWYVKTAAVALATVVGYSVNVVLVAWFVRLASPEPTRGVIREMHRGILGELVLSYMGLALFGVVIATFFVHEGVLSIVVFIAPLVFARQMMTRTHSLKKATDELEAQRGELADIIANTSDGIFTVGMDGLVATWNPAMERITGFAADEAIGRDLEALIGRPLDLVQSEQGSTRDGLIRTKPGAERWMRYTVNPVPAVAGGRRGYVVVARDVTAQLATERLQAEFVSTVSHELRTPLTPLKGFLSALVRRRLVAPEAELHEYYEIMLRQTTRLERLIGELLDTTQIQSGSLQVRPETVDLSALVAEEVQMCSEDHPDRTITGRVEPATLATADPIRVSQVLANLLSNAVKYSPPGSTIEVGLVRERERAVAWVRDHGPGIPASERERVFDRFHRIDNGTTRTAGGTGLGLYIARQLVQAMGGLIWVRSSPGAGSTFSFSLPLARTRRDPAPVEESVPTAEEVPTAEAVLSGVAD